MDACKTTAHSSAGGNGGLADGFRIAGGEWTNVRRAVPSVARIGWLLALALVLAAGCARNDSAAGPEASGPEGSAPSGVSADAMPTREPASGQGQGAVNTHGADVAQAPEITSGRESAAGEGGAVAGAEVSETASQRTGLPAGGESAPADPAASPAADAHAAATPHPRPQSAAQVAGGEPPGGAAAEDPDELFAGWNDPQFVLLISGRQHGYIEPCGCTGLANQKGGLARRHRLQRELQERGWKVVPVDVGNQVRRFGRQAEIKFQMTSEALQTMQYRAVALGPDDLKLSTGELIAVTAGDGSQPGPYLCANVAILDRSLLPAYKVVEVAGRKIGITAVLGDEYLQGVNGDEILCQPAKEGLAEVWPKLESEKCDLYVLLAHASIEQSQQLAAGVGKFDLVVTAGGAGEPTYKPQPVPGSQAVMVQCGTKGMYAGVIGVFDDQRQPLRYQRVPLDARFEDSRDMLQLLAAYQQQLRTLGLEGLGLKPLPHGSGRQFVGSESCQSCHEDAYDIWKETPHSHATESLVHPGERTEIPRHFDPECLSCHVTGWNPQKFFPYESGYLSLQGTPKMHGSGCENCHGPGSRHVAAESGDIDADEDELLKLRAEMRLPLDTARQKCLECHDLDNSPDFHLEGAFEKYWQRIAH